MPPIRAIVAGVPALLSPPVGRGRPPPATAPPPVGPGSPPRSQSSLVRWKLATTSGSFRNCLAATNQGSWAYSPPWNPFSALSWLPTSAAISAPIRACP
ncbi:MAG: hypothetical protein R3F62_15285 [Planctomycetota bacterium]